MESFGFFRSHSTIIKGKLVFCKTHLDYLTRVLDRVTWITIIRLPTRQNKENIHHGHSCYLKQQLLLITHVPHDSELKGQHKQKEVASPVVSRLYKGKN